MLWAKKELEREVRCERSLQKLLKWAKNEIRYYQESVKDYIKVRDEGMLNLAIQFAVKELGCEKI